MNQQQIRTFISSPNPVNEDRYKNKKRIVNILAKVEIFLSLFAFCGGIAEVSLHGYTCKSNNSPYYGNWYSCHHLRSIGQGIWCAVFPFLAAIFGLYASSKSSSESPSKTKIRLLMGFSIVGSIFMGVMCISELSLLSHRPSSFRTLQILLICVASLNMVLLIVSASLSCCLGNCCEKKHQVIYVAYKPVDLPIQPPSCGTANPQMMAAINPQMMVMTPTPQMMTVNTPQMPVTFAPQPNQMIFAQPQMFPVIQQQPQMQSQQPFTNPPPKYQQTEDVQ